jgi:DNA-directed RNA polymerase subunit L
MEITVVESEKNKLKLSMNTNRHTLPNILTKVIWEESDVDVAGYNLYHTETSDPVLIVQTKKKDAKKVLLEAVSTLKKRNKEFAKEMKKAAK